ncbi:hypothetical protein [Novacetimonas pomaceti]|uniref:hypothetical protein n=1 Tax=Novacetimonas pomaceti TaxID=2021998 RepID=UPI001C2DD6D7|nr:hypothetical protein [Novacetimonas pomaceti]MBV1835225.1 hypothetical protein [Novacetimonas pomaceti]
MSTNAMFVVFILVLTTNICMAGESLHEQEKHACEKDAFKFCVKDIPNKKKIAACLQARREQLHPACRVMFPANNVHAGNKV